MRRRPLMFDLSQLQCFVAVAEELHFGRAAARLHMTQPPLSRQIKILEHVLEAQLFVRTSRSVRITPAGRSFLPEALRLLKLAESAALVAKSISSGKAGTVKIGFTAGSAQSFLPTLVTECRKLLPGVNLLLKEMVSGDQIDALEPGQIDIGSVSPGVHIQTTISIFPWRFSRMGPPPDRATSPRSTRTGFGRTDRDSRRNLSPSSRGTSRFQMRRASVSKSTWSGSRRRTNSTRDTGSARATMRLRCNSWSLAGNSTTSDPVLCADTTF